VMIDAIRCAKIALDRKLSGPMIGPSSYFFKTPPQQFRDSICREKVEDYIAGKGNE
jgi:myo-inositol-1-phosphate synthase